MSVNPKQPQGGDKRPIPLGQARAQRTAANEPPADVLSANLKLEAQLLGAVFLHPYFLPVVRRFLPDATAAFSDADHRAAYGAMQRVYDGGGVCEPVAVADELTRSGASESLMAAYTTVSALATRGASMPALAIGDTERMLEDWARRLAQHAVLRGLVRVATTAAGYAYTRDEEVTPASALASLRLELAALEAATEQASGARFHLHTIAELRARPRPTWLLPGILQAGKLGLLYGDTNTGKSFLALHWGLSLATQEDARPVVFVAAEGGESLSTRIDAWLARHPEVTQADGTLPPFYVITDAPNFLEPGDVEQVIGQIRGTLGEDVQPALVVLDTVAMVMSGGSENDADTMGALVQAMKRVQRELGSAVLGIHHIGKDESRGPRGHSSLKAALDTAVELTGSLDPETGTGDLMLSCKKMRDAARFSPLAFRLVSQALDEHGDTTSCVVVPVEHGTVEAQTITTAVTQARMAAKSGPQGARPASHTRKEPTAVDHIRRILSASPDQSLPKHTLIQRFMAESGKKDLRSWRVAKAAMVAAGELLYDMDTDSYRLSDDE